MSTQKQSCVPAHTWESSEIKEPIVGLAGMSWKGSPWHTHPLSHRWASSSQDSRPDSSRVVYDDVPYEKVQVSVTQSLTMSHCCGGGVLGILGGLWQSHRCFSMLSTAG